MYQVLPTVLRPASRGPSPLRQFLGLIDMGRSRKRLGDLDDHLLRDLGLTRDAARHEAERMDWDVPAHWLR